MRRLDWQTWQTDPRPLAIARILVGVAGVGKLLIVAPNLMNALSGEYIRLPYPIQVPAIHDEQFALAICLVWLTATVQFLLGYMTRIAGTLLASSMLYVMLIDQQLYSNHHYLMVLVVALLTFGDCGGAYSIDSWRGRTRSAVSGWPQLLLKLQLSSVYGFAAITKINAEFLRGEIFEGWVNPRALELMLGHGGLTLFAASAITIELFLAIAFWSRRARWVAFPLGIGFHLSLIWVMGTSVGYDFVVFAIVMCAMYLQFYGDVIASSTNEASLPGQIPAAEHAA